MFTQSNGRNNFSKSQKLNMNNFSLDDSKHYSRMKFGMESFTVHSRNLFLIDNVAFHNYSCGYFHVKLRTLLKQLAIEWSHSFMPLHHLISHPVNDQNIGCIEAQKSIQVSIVESIYLSMD